MDKTDGTSFQLTNFPTNSPKKSTTSPKEPEANQPIARANRPTNPMLTVERPQIGEVISNATLRPQDLLKAFATALERFRPNATCIGEARRHLDHLAVDDAAPTEITLELLWELEERLNAVAPDNCYFGANPGNGSCFGFWKVEDDNIPDPEDYQT